MFWQVWWFLVALNIVNSKWQVLKTLTFLPPVQGIDFATRKVAKLLKPQKVIKQDGDSFYIHTTSTFRDYLLQFKIGEEFEEDNKGLDNRKCKVRLNI